MCPANREEFLQHYAKRAGYITSHSEEVCAEGPWAVRTLLPDDYVDFDFWQHNCSPHAINSSHNEYCTFGGKGYHEHSLAHLKRVQQVAAQDNKPFFAAHDFLVAHIGTDSDDAQELTRLSVLDADLETYLMDLSEACPRCVIALYGDHGFNDFWYTGSLAGKIEHRNAYLEFLIPDALVAEHPEKVEMLKANSQTLTSMFDLHDTLRGIMLLEQPYLTKLDVPWSHDLFSERVPPQRTCEEARIPPEFCMCEDTIGDWPVRYSDAIYRSESKRFEVCMTTLDE
jgi:hypothetical protein